MNYLERLNDLYFPNLADVRAVMKETISDWDLDDLWVDPSENSLNGKELSELLYDAWGDMENEIEVPFKLIKFVRVNRESNGYCLGHMQCDDVYGCLSLPFTETTLKDLVNKGLIVDTKTQKQEIKPMSKVKTIATTAITANKSAGIEAAKLKVGKTALNVAVKAIKPKLPMGTKGFADHPLAKIAVANIIAIAVGQVAADNPKAKAISDAMLTASYFMLAEEIDIEGMIDDMLGQFKGSAVDKITDAIKSEEIVIDE